MNCQQCLEHLDEYAIARDRSHFVDVAEHLQDCPECREVLEETTNTWSLLAATIEPAKPSSSLEAKVFEQAEAANVAPAGQQTTILPEYVPYLIAAMVLVLATVGVYFVRYRASDGDDVRQFDRQVRRLQEFELRFGNPEVFYVSLNDTRDRRVSACVVYDGVANQLHFFVTRLNSPSAEAKYKIWIYDDDRLVASSNLEANETGMLTAVVSLDRPLGKVRAVVTLEQDPTAAAPSGREYLRTQLRLSTGMSSPP